MDFVWRRRIWLTSACSLSVVLAGLLAACTSATTNVAAPTASKCAVTATTSTNSVPAGGADATVNVDTTRDCTWSATTSTAWITLGATTTGQGSGAVDARIAANPNPVARDGAVAVNGLSVAISQAAAPCTFSVAPANAAINAGGGSVTVQVATLAGCAWTSSSGAPWLAVSGGANGPASVAITATANAGTARAGTVTVAGQAVTITQAAPAPPAAAPAPTPAPEPPPTPNPTPVCSYALSSTSYQSSAAGAVFSVSLATASACSWTTHSNAPWITVVSAASGMGGATVVLSAAPNTGGARAGTVTIGGQTFDVAQDAFAPPPPPCTYTISPKTVTVSSKEESGSLAVTAGPTCAWTATPNDSWITITAGASGTGNGTVQYAVSANDNKKQRSGTMSIAGLTFTITQSGTN